MPTAISVVGVLFAFAVILWLILTRARPRGVNGPDYSRAQSTAVETDQNIAQARQRCIPERFVVFDLETTGLDPERHEIIEIGAIKVNRGCTTHEALQYLVKPRKRIPKMITRINGISQAMVDQEGESLEHVLKEFAEFIEDLPLVSFNADFDMGFLQVSAKRHGITIRNPVACALRMAREAWPGRESYKLTDLARDGNLPIEDAHRALGDCKRTVLVYTAAATKLYMSKRP